MSTIEVNSAGQFEVSGELSFTTVPELNTRGLQLIAASPQPVFDLRNVTNSDYAGVALLTSWTRHAKKLGKAVFFINPPAQLLDMAKVSGLKDILPIREHEIKTITT